MPMRERQEIQVLLSDQTATEVQMGDADDWRLEDSSPRPQGGPMNDIEALPIGSKCKIGTGSDIDGTINAVTVYPCNLIKYLVAWWNGGVRTESWLDVYFIEPATTERMRI